MCQLKWLHSCCLQGSGNLGWIPVLLPVSVVQNVPNTQELEGRRTAEGLAYAMFICSISANCLYGLGILIRTYDASQLWNSLPWLIGSLGTVSLDVIILSQVAIATFCLPVLVFSWALPIILSMQAK